MNVAEVKRRAYRDQEYWGKPVPGFGDPGARVFVIGLAPGAHGANRTGRMFTGDRSGDYLYRALWENGFASQPVSASRDDGLVLIDCYIASSVRCAPPDNKPAAEEILACRPYLVRELALFPQVVAIIALGKLAFDNYLAVLKETRRIQSRAAFSFGHNREHVTGPDQPLLISSYHPSQQNTSTGKLTREMLSDVFARARARLQADPVVASRARPAVR
jgi:uracil-DNA glycosylase